MNFVTRPLYYRTTRFFPSKKYEKHSKIVGRKEIVTYDAGLGIKDLSKYTDSAEDFKLLLETPLSLNEQIVAYYMNPSKNHISSLYEEGFEFCGYDLADKIFGCSAITLCCGRFEAAIPYDTLNEYGLISNYNEALLALDLLHNLYPDDPHSNCEMFELWRLVA